MPGTDTIFKPKYTLSMRFALLLYPAWLGLAIYFAYQWAVTGSFNPQGFLAVVFGLMSISLPLRVIREIRFGEAIVIKRYLLPDIVMEYKDVTGFNTLEIKTQNANMTLLMMTPESFGELEQMMNRLMSAKKIRLAKKVRG